MRMPNREGVFDLERLEAVMSQRHIFRCPLLAANFKKPSSTYVSQISRYSAIIAGHLETAKIQNSLLAHLHDAFDPHASPESTPARQHAALHLNLLHSAFAEGQTSPNCPL